MVISAVVFSTVLFASVLQHVNANCACATTSVHIRSGPGTSHSQLGTTYPGFCFLYKGNKAAGNGYTWAEIDYNGKNGWIAENFVHFKTCPSSVHTGSGSSHTGTGSSQTGTILGGTGCPRILSEHEWGARKHSHSLYPLAGPVKYVIIHHGASHACHTQASCTALAKAYQADHMDSRGYGDVGYSFLVGEDGNVYEGRGWDTVGAHTLNYNHHGLGFCMMGNFMERLPDQKALTAVQKLIACGVRKGKIQTNYILKGHRDVGATACPGNKLYDVIKHWPHYV